MKITLIGPRGSGKTKVSLFLARQLKIPLLSLDTLIQYESGGKSIPEIINQSDRGWKFFRDLEYQVLKKAIQLPSVLIDCGGGVVVDIDENQQEILSQRKIGLLKKSIVFFLNAPFAEVVNKIMGDQDRPSLSQQSTAQQIYEFRLPLYRQVMDHEIKIHRRERKTAASEIIHQLEKMRKLS